MSRWGRGCDFGGGCLVFRWWRQDYYVHSIFIGGHLPLLVLACLLVLLLFPLVIIIGWSSVNKNRQTEDGG